MTNWIKLTDKLPEPNSGELILGCDWYSEDKDEPRILVCENKPEDVHSYGELQSHKSLPVSNSICPSIGVHEDGYWMPLCGDEDKKWKNFVPPPIYPHNWDHEVLIKLYNGNYYIAFIENYCWEPTFNMMKSGSLESIDKWMELPKSPPYLPPPILTSEEKEIKEEKKRKWNDKLDKRFQFLLKKNRSRTT